MSTRTLTCPVCGNSDLQDRPRQVPPPGTVYLGQPVQFIDQTYCPRCDRYFRVSTVLEPVVDFITITLSVPKK